MLASGKVAVMWPRLAVVIGCAALVFGFFAVADQAESETPEQVTVETRTVYVKGHRGDELAEEINRAHQSSVPVGWEFVHLAIQNENNDVEGAWITYTRRR